MSQNRIFIAIITGLIVGYALWVWQQRVKQCVTNGQSLETCVWTV